MVATVAPAAAQPTAMGQELHRLAIFDGHLYSAFGDYNADTGPIAVASLDLATQTLGSTEATFNTEELWTLKVLGGRLFAPFMDPRGFNDATQGQYGVANAAGSWTVQTGVTSPVPIHVFDVLENADGLWLFGASGDANPDTGTGTIWRSTDDGATWTESLGLDGGGSARIYAAVQLGDTMLASYTDGLGGHTTLRWDVGTSTTWTQLDSATSTAAGFSTYAVNDPAPFTVNDTPLYLCADHGKDFGHVTAATPIVVSRPEDSTTRAAVQAGLPFATVYDAANSTAGLYVIGFPTGYTGDPILYRCDTAGSWTALATLDPSVRSIAVDEPGGWLYFGTTDSRILRTATPA